MRILFLLVAVISGCTSSATLEITDIDIREPDALLLAQNFIDTTIVISPGTDETPDLITYLVYNSRGQVIFDNTSPMFPVQMYYDQNGFITRTTVEQEGSDWVDSATYTFDRDSLFLYQRWTRQYIKFKFNDRGQLIEKIESKADGSNSVRFISKFFYDGERRSRHDAYLAGDSSPFTTISYFYTKEKLDSSIMKVKIDDRLYKDVYDSDGLIKISFHGNDTSRIYIHKSRQR